METTHHTHPHYVLIWVILAVLTAAEVGLTFVSHLPHNTLVVVLLALSIWKVLLVALYFMHLKYETFRIRLLIVAPMPLILALMLATLWDWKWLR